MKKLRIPYNDDRRSAFIETLPGGLVVLYDSFNLYLTVVAGDAEPSFWSY